MRISNQLLSIAATMLLISGCSREPDNSVLAKVEAEQVRDAAAAGRIPCALAGAEAFRLNCTMERIAGPQGETLVMGRADAGYRRFRVTSDGRGVIAADGSDPAQVTLIDDGQIEVAVAGDRYRLPATVKGSQ
jgi:hypothetical protein